MKDIYYIIIIPVVTTAFVMIINHISIGLTGNLYLRKKIYFVLIINTPIFIFFGWNTFCEIMELPYKKLTLPRVIHIINGDEKFFEPIVISKNGNNFELDELENLNINRIIQAQLSLEERGCYNGKIDGQWGEKSQYALNLYLKIANSGNNSNIEYVPNVYSADFSKTIKKSNIYCPNIDNIGKFNGEFNCRFDSSDGGDLQFIINDGVIKIISRIDGFRYRSKAEYTDTIIKKYFEYEKFTIYPNKILHRTSYYMIIGSSIILPTFHEKTEQVKPDWPTIIFNAHNFGEEFVANLDSYDMYMDEFMRFVEQAGFFPGPTLESDVLNCSVYVPFVELINYN